MSKDGSVLYFGFDESEGNGLIRVMCISRNPSDVEPKEFEKRRDLDEEVLRYDFFYTNSRTRPHKTEGRVLIQKGIRKFGNHSAIELYFDGIPDRIIKKRWFGWPKIRSIHFINNGDKTIPLLHRADHIASMLGCYYSSAAHNQERIKKFKARYPELDERIARTGVGLPPKV